MARLSTMGEMATGLSHELNQPLSAIANYAGGIARHLERGSSTVDALTKSVEKIATQVERAGEIIRRLRRLVSKTGPQRSRVNIDDCILEVIKLAEPELRQKGITIELSLGDDSASIEVDSIQIQQVILNLVRNAIDAMDSIRCGERRMLIQRSAIENDSVEIVVRDTGIGLPSEVVEHLFEPFFTTKGEGLGMGLSISRSIIEAHGGRLEATSNSTGGATFRIVLPVGADEAIENAFTVPATIADQCAGSDWFGN